MGNRQDIYAEIDQERTAQDAEWGGVQHDDTHSAGDWLTFLRKHWTLANNETAVGPGFRRQMIRVAALAVATVEWFDRKQSEPTV